MDSHANYKWAGTSKVKPSYYPLFQKIEFENLLDNVLWLHQQIIERLDETDLLIEDVIHATKPYNND
jgi:superfamily I DNA and RNA helicase